MPQIILDLTDEQVQGLRENAIRNMPELPDYKPKTILEFIVKATTENDRRQKAIAKARSLDVSVLEDAIKDL